MITTIDDPTGLAKRMRDINPEIVENLSRTSTDEHPPPQNGRLTNCGDGCAASPLLFGN